MAEGDAWRRPHALGDGVGELLGEAAAGVEQEKDGGHGMRIVAERAKLPNPSAATGAEVWDAGVCAAYPLRTQLPMSLRMAAFRGSGANEASTELRARRP